MLSIDDLKKLSADRMLEVIKYYTPLKQDSKDEWLGICPFHDDHHPSLSVNPAEGVWHCFSCGAGGKGGLSFIMKKETMTFPQALNKLREILGLEAYEGGTSSTGPVTEQVDPVDMITFEWKAWSDRELIDMGSPVDGDGRPVWTGDNMEKTFSFFSVKSYTRPPAKGREKSLRTHSSETYPIFSYKYVDQKTGEEWGRLYLPKGNKNSRFFNWPAGRDHKDDIFGDAELMKALAAAREKKPANGVFDHIFLLSGGSDAINAYMRLPELNFPQGDNFTQPHVCWLGSETAYLTPAKYHLLECLLSGSERERRGKLYICYDLDETGRKRMHQTALQYPDISVVYLPQRMYVTSAGKQKDIKDYFRHYILPEGSNTKEHEFKLMFKASNPIRFWEHKQDKNGEPKKEYQIITENLKTFINVHNFFRLVRTDDEEMYIELLDNNIVRSVSKDAMETKARELMIGYIKGKDQYFDKPILECINKTRLVASTLRLIEKIELNFYNADAATREFLYFRNGIFGVTATDVEKVGSEDAGYYVYEEKVRPYDFKPVKEHPFEIRYTSLYRSLLARRDNCQSGTKDWEDANKDVLSVSDMDKYMLNFPDREKTVSLIQYLYNTGCVYWEKMKRGEALTPAEQSEHDLNFMNKCWAYGYLLRKWKEPSNALAVMALENTVMEKDEQDGGTGKSLFFKCLNILMNPFLADMRMVNLRQKGDAFFGGLDEHKQDLILMEDLQSGEALDFAYVCITNFITVRNLHENKRIVSFEESPKIGLSSNKLPKLDGSDRRRLLFVLFSDYYHAAKPEHGFSNEFNPCMEFGHNIITDYTPEQINETLNFFAYCIQINMQFPAPIRPVMDNIELRRLRESIKADSVFEWFENTFNEEPGSPGFLNRAFWANDMFEEYKRHLGKDFRERVEIRSFKKKLADYCGYKGYFLNPNVLSQNKSDRGFYRKTRKLPDGTSQQQHFWFIQSGPLTQETFRKFEGYWAVDPLCILPPADNKKETTEDGNQ